MLTKLNVERYSIEKDGERYNIFAFIEDDINFYIERKGYNNLYHICNIPDKDKIDNIIEFMNNNKDSWIFFVLNETEED